MARLEGKHGRITGAERNPTVETDGKQQVIYPDDGPWEPRVEVHDGWFLSCAVPLENGKTISVAPNFLNEAGGHAIGGGFWDGGWDASEWTDEDRRKIRLASAAVDEAIS